MTADKITPQQYDELCKVIDHIKIADRLEDTDVYAGAVLSILGLEVDAS